jgi:ATP-dependent DNA helicase RecQ
MTPPPTIEQARDVLRRCFGYPAFRAGQERAVRAVLAGRDTLVIFPTGGGKSLCYQIPALLLPRLTVVVSPLISLMKDQVDALAARGLPAAFMNSTLTPGEMADRLARAERGELKLLYVAPERFEVGSTAERLRKIGVSLLAVDEAHCISEWGHDFRPSYLRIRSVRERLGAPPVIALTATATPEVRRDILHQLALTHPEIIITGFDRRNLHYHVVRARTEQDKDAALVATLERSPGLAVVYAATRRAVERITRRLDRARVSAVAYHAGLDDAHRHDVQEAFMREQVRVIVATNAFGMGIDKPNVRLVVHYAMPGTLEAYYQEAGRAGRDGERSDCVLLHAFPDRFTHEFFITSAYPERAVVERVYAALQRSADATGLARLGSAELAARAGGVRDREVESAIRILAHAGVLHVDSPTTSRIWVRLLATPERLRAELAGGDPVERDLLRALWRVVRARLYDGVVIDPGGLPPGFGGSAGVAPILDRLQARQLVLWERTGGGIRLSSGSLPVSDLPIDWAGLERRRAADLAKLDAMQRYAYTTGCRRSFLLRYFGDPAAARSCNGCDVCLGTHMRPGERRPNAGGPTRAAPRPKPSRRAPEAGTGSAGGLTGAEAELVSALKALRTRLARAERIPPYCIFSDRTVVEMALRRPQSLEALAEVHGVGPVKLEKYGEPVLAILRHTTATHSEGAS